MEIAEIKVSYMSNCDSIVKVSSSKIAYDIVLLHWNKEILEYQEEVKLLLLNRANIVLGIHELSKGGTTGCIVDVKMVLAIALKCNAHGIIVIHYVE